MVEAEADATSQLSKKLDVVLNVLLHFARKDANFNGGKRDAGDIAHWLNKVGLSNADIATILGSSSGSVSVMLHRKRKASKKSKRK